jgi:hypothetical protein
MPDVLAAKFEWQGIKRIAAVASLQQICLMRRRNNVAAFVRYEGLERRNKNEVRGSARGGMSWSVLQEGHRRVTSSRYLTGAELRAQDGETRLV